MATATVSQASSQGATLNIQQGFSDAFAMMGNPVVWIFLFFFMILVLLVVFYVRYLQNNDINKEREDVVYATYKKHMRSCKHMPNNFWINVKWSFKNIFFFCLPVFIKDYSLKIVDKEDNLIGRYRGHFLTPQGETIWAITRRRKFLILDDIELLRTINTFTYTIQSTKKGVPETKTIDYNPLYTFYPESTDKRNYKSMKIQCYGIEESQYYLVPRYIEKDGESKEKLLDLTGIENENLRAYTTEEQLKRLMADSNKYMDEVGRMNPTNTFKRFEGEKTEEEIKRDDQQRGQL